MRRRGARRRHRGHQPTRAAGFLFRAKRDVFLCRRVPSGVWSIPGGYRDRNVDRAWVSTATRETQEELGFVPPLPDVAYLYHLERSKDGRVDQIYTVIEARLDTPFPLSRVQLNEEHDACGWFPLRDLVAGESAEWGELHLHPGLLYLLTRLGTGNRVRLRRDNV